MDMNLAFIDKYSHSRLGLKRWTEDLLCKCEDLCLSPSIHIESQAWVYPSIIPVTEETEALGLAQQFAQLN